MKKSDGSFTRWWIKATVRLHLALVCTSVHRDVQTRQCHLNKGPHTHASDKFTVRHLWRSEGRGRVGKWNMILLVRDEQTSGFLEPYFWLVRDRRVPLLSPNFDSSGTNRGGFLSPTFDSSGTNRRVRLLSPTFRHLVGLLGRVGGEASLPQCLYLHRTAQHRKTRTNMNATILHIMLDSNTRSQNPISPRLRTPYAVRP
jgi:hypothetical protein